VNDQDKRAAAILTAMLAAAVTIRDEGPDAVQESLRAVLDTAGGDPLAALAIAAALIPVDQPVDRWWQTLRSVPITPDTKPPNVDPIAVERRIHGEKVPLSSAELTDAVRQMTERGNSAAFIAARLHVTQRTVTRHRAKDVA
jgi:DNA-binding NarL/FixJ family response regulator